MPQAKNSFLPFFLFLLSFGVFAQESTLREEVHQIDIPVLGPAAEKPVSVSYQEGMLTEVLEDIGAQAGITVRLHSSFNKSRKVTLTLEKRPARWALNKVLDYAGHFFVPVDERTILVAQDSGSRRRNLEQLQTSTFFLSTGSANSAAQVMRATIPEISHSATNKELNSITVVAAPEILAKVRETLTHMDQPLSKWQVSILAKTKGGIVALKETSLQEEAWEYQVSSGRNGLKVHLRAKDVLPGSVTVQWKGDVHVFGAESQHSFGEEDTATLRRKEEFSLVKTRTPEYQTVLQQLLGTDQPVKEVLLRVERQK